MIGSTFRSSKKHTNFTVHLMASYSIILLIILFMGLSLYYLSIRNLRSDIHQQNATILKNAAQSLDSDFMSMSRLATQLTNDSDLVLLANMEPDSQNTFYIKAWEVKSDLSMFLPTTGLLPIENYFIHLQKTGYMIASNAFEPLEHYYSNKRKLNPQLFPQWKSTLDQPENHYRLIPISEFSEDYTPLSGNFFYIASLSDFSFKQIAADLCFEISQRRLSSIFSGLELGENSSLCVTDSIGSPLFILGDRISSLTQKEQSDFLTLLSGLSYDTQTSSAPVTAPDGEKLLATTHHSSYNQWFYYYIASDSLMLASLNSYRNLFLLGIALAVFGGFILILIISHHNSRPIEAMVSQLTQSRQQQQKLLELAESQKPVLRRSYIQQIMKGSISSQQELEYVREYLHLEQDHDRKYQVLYCNIYLNKYEVNTGSNTIVGIPSSNYDEIITNTMRRFWGEPLYMISPNERSYALLLSTDGSIDNDRIISSIEKIFREIHDYLIQQHDIWIFGGLGNRNGQLSFTWKSYQQAKEALHYASGDHFFQCYCTLRPNSENYYYPNELAVQLTNFIESGNRQQLTEIFKLLYHENMQKRALSTSQVQWLLSDIRNTILKVRFTIHEDTTNQADLYTIDSAFDKVDSLKSYEEISLLLCNLTRTDNSENQLIATIKNYIFHNYQDPALCLSKISDEFSISESYFSYLFKRTTGENFSVYLERIRMEQAVSLIRNTDTKLSALYQLLGYNNANSFRRAFKKIYGCSPTSMRGGKGDFEDGFNEEKNHNI